MHWQSLYHYLKHVHSVIISSARFKETSLNSARVIRDAIIALLELFLLEADLNSGFDIMASGGSKENLVPSPESSSSESSSPPQAQGGMRRFGAMGNLAGAGGSGSKEQLVPSEESSESPPPSPPKPPPRKGGLRRVGAFGNLAAAGGSGSKEQLVPSEESSESPPPSPPKPPPRKGGLRRVGAFGNLAGAGGGSGQGAGSRMRRSSVDETSRHGAGAGTSKQIRRSSSMGSMRPGDRTPPPTPPPRGMRRTQAHLQLDQMAHGQPVAGTSRGLQTPGAHFSPKDEAVRIRTASDPSKYASWSIITHSSYSRPRSSSAPHDHHHHHRLKNHKSLLIDPESDIQDDDNLMDAVEQDWDGRVINCSPKDEDAHFEQFGFNMTNEEELGEGGFGTVHVCIRQSDGERFAMKIIDTYSDFSGRSQSPNTQKFSSWGRGVSAYVKLCDIQHEVAVMMNIKKNPFVVQHIDHFMINGRACVVMEMEDGSLKDQLKCYMNGMSERKARKWFMQICEGVKYMHHVGIAHRDLKPDNILVRRMNDGSTWLKVSDFGLSRFTKRASERFRGKDPNNEVGMDKLQTVCGTPEYFAPELVILYLDAMQESGFDPTGFKLESMPTEKQATFYIPSSSQNPRTGSTKPRTLEERPVPEHLKYDGRKVDAWALGLILFNMLFATHPFPKDVMRNKGQWHRYLDLQQRKHWNIPFLAANTTSSTSMAYLRAILEGDPAKRLDAQQILKHAWFNGKTKEPGFRTHKVNPMVKKFFN